MKVLTPVLAAGLLACFLFSPSASAQTVPPPQAGSGEADLLTPPGLERRPVDWPIQGETRDAPSQASTGCGCLYHWLWITWIDRVGQAVAEYFNEVWTPVVGGSHCTIDLWWVKGAKKLPVGNFAAETDPHADARIFIDTAFDGVILASPDVQNIRYRVKVGPANLDPTKYEVRWEVRDPDDPANHYDLDPNDGGKLTVPLGTAKAGGDNYDTKPADGAGHFFTLAKHPISAQLTPGSDGGKAGTVIGSAITQIDANRRSTVQFNFTDEGGDNFIITAKCVEKATGKEHDGDSTGTLTVWRKRYFKLTGMDKPQDDTQAIAVGGVGANATADGVGPGVNGFVDTFLKQGTDDVYQDADGTGLDVGADKTSNTAANHGGESFYPGGNLATMAAAIRLAYANPTANRNPYIDPVVTELADDTAYDGVTTESDGTNSNTEEHSYSLASTTYHAEEAHPDNTYHLLGIRAFDNSAVTGNWGSSVVVPHAYINLLMRYSTSAAATEVSAGLRHTSTHELGHCAAASTVNIHAGHSGDAPWSECLGRSGVLDLEWCSLHTATLRRRVTRSWPDHDNDIASPVESASDSE